MAARKAVRRRRTREQWTEILRRFEASGLSAREFCRQEALAVSTLQRWRTRLGSAVVPAFVELMASSRPVIQPQPSWALELTLPDGVCLRLRG